MFNFKNLVTTALFAVPFLGAITPQKADAATSYCYETVNGSTVCILEVRKHRTNPYVRLVKSSVDGYVSYDEVTCYSAHRYNYKKNMAGIACFEFYF